MKPNTPKAPAKEHVLPPLFRRLIAPWLLLSLKQHSAVNSGASASFPVTIRVTGYSHSIDVPVRRCLYVYLREGSQTHRYLHT